MLQARKISEKFPRQIVIAVDEEDAVQTTVTEKKIDTATQMTLEHALAWRLKRSTTQTDSKII